MRSEQRLSIAIQKSGRLSDESIRLIERCGIKMRKSHNKLFCQGENFPLDILLVRDDDIPSLVIDDVCDLGIVGGNVLREIELKRRADGQNFPIETVQTLDFGACRLAIAMPSDAKFDNMSALNDKRIATSYPAILQDFLHNHNVQAEMMYLSGSVEIAPRLNMADAICDLVSTGATLEANGLREVKEVYASKAILVKTQRQLSEEQQRIMSLLHQRLKGVMQACESKYIMLHAPKAKLKSIMSLLPGLDAPTVMTLEGCDDKVGLHVVCRENIFWETLERLKALGASSILVLPVEKMMI